MTRRSRHIAVLAVWSAVLLSIGITRQWRLVHEDNGAMQLTLALSHTREGLAVTSAHNWFSSKDGSARLGYPHHPPGVPLLLAVAFEMTGSESRAVARAVMILFSIGNVLLLYVVLGHLFGNDSLSAFAGALFAATVPMMSFFGRMVNYEPPVMFFILLLLLGHLRRRPLLMAGAIVAGLMIDWTVLFFCAAIVVAEGIDWARGQTLPRIMTIVAIASAAGLAIQFAHITVAFGSPQRFFEVLGKDVGVGHEPLRLTNFLALMFENYRHYFTSTGVVVSLLVWWRPGRLRPDVRRFLLIAGGAALAYVLASPNRARLHHYWQFFFLPYAAVAFIVALEWVRARRARWLALLMVLEIALATGYKLYRRHTEPGEYAVTAIEHYERLYLTP